MSNVSLSDIDVRVQNKLRNAVNSPFSQTTRVYSYNDVLDRLQTKANWLDTKRVAIFDFLDQETDYLLSDMGIDDFKAYKSLRIINTSQNTHLQKFEEINGEDFDVFAGQNNWNYTVNFEDRAGDKYMRVLADVGQRNVIVDDMEDLTTGRTWSSDAVNSDATTLAVDTTKVKQGSSCLIFNIDVSQSVNNYAKIYTSIVLSNTIDATDLENNGYFRFWLGLHSVSSANLALITSITFIWGSDSSNYWTQTSTKPVNYGSFNAGWNRMSFAWGSATKTGTPDASALDYFEIRINYSSGFSDSNNIRIDQIKMFTPTEMELIYFSKNMVSKSGVWQEHFTTTTIDGTEQLVLNQKHLPLFVNMALMELFPQKERTSDDYIRVANEVKEQLDLAINQDGESVVREKDTFDIQGTSSGRSDIGTNQW